MHQDPVMAESVIQTEPRSPTPMRETVSIPPPALTLQDRPDSKPATVCIWQLFNTSGKYWLKGAKCVRLRLFYGEANAAVRKMPICSFKLHFCCCFFCSWGGRNKDPCCGVEICGLCGEHHEEESDPGPQGEYVDAINQWQATRTQQNDPSLEVPDVPVIVSLEMQTYIFVGLLDSDSGGVREQLEKITDRDGLSRTIRKATKDLRPFYIRFFSLKTIGGFGLYRCEPSGDYHVPIDLDDQSSATFHELFSGYSSHDVDWEARWKNWVHEYLNGGSTDPQVGRYALRLILRWSILKIVIYTTIPVALSLVIGLWFMLGTPQDPNDSYTAIVQTAWSISSYIITVAGVIVALLAAVTVLGDKP